MNSLPRLLRAVGPLLALAAIHTSGYGVLFTLIGDYGEAYGLSESMLGLIIATGFITGFIAQVLIGPLGDRGHASKLIAIGALANIVGLLAMGFGTTAAVILGGRVISGLGLGAAAPAIRRAVIVSSDDDIGANLGALFSVEVFGFAIGPVISAVLVGPLGIPGPFVAIAILNLLVVGYVIARVEITEATEPEPSRLAFDLLGQRPFAGAVMLGTGAFVMIGTFDVLWDVVHTELGTPDWMANLGITLFALPLVLLGPFAGKLAQRVGPFIVAAVGLVVASLFMGAYGVLTSGVAIFWFSLGHALSDGLTFAASGVAVGMAVPEERQAGAQGVLGGMQALGAGIAAVITGVIFENFGQQAAYWFGAGLVLALTAGGVLLAGPALRMRDGDDPDGRPDQPLPHDTTIGPDDVALTAGQ